MPMIDMIATGANIKNMVKAKKMTIAEIQNVFGFQTPQAIYKWFRGDAMPTIDNLVILATIFDVKIDDIVITTK